MALAIYDWLTAQYAYSVYCAAPSSQKRRLYDGDGCVGPLVVPANYVDAVITYAATHYALELIAVALANNYINQAEYDSTVAQMPQ